MSDLPSAKRQRRADDDASDTTTINPFSMLPDAVLDVIFSFIGTGKYRYIAGTNRSFRNVYDNERNNRGKLTFWTSAAASVACAKLVVEDYKLLETQESVVRIALDRISMGAAKTGNVAVLEWARQNSVRFCDMHFRLVGEGGHISVLEWADSTHETWGVLDYYCLLYGAAMTGNVNVLKWIVNHSRHRHAIENDEENVIAVWRNAGQGGHLPVLELLRDHNVIPTNDDAIIFYHAAHGGQLNVLDWLVEHGHQVPDYVYDTIVKRGASEGHIPILEWVKTRGGTFTLEACAFAAKHGHLSALQWLRSNDCPWDGSVLAYAARKGHDHVVEWARANGCPVL